MNLDDIDMDDLVDICEGNDGTAELLKKFIKDNPAHMFVSNDLRKQRIAEVFADYMNGFWDEGCTDEEGEFVDEEDHWEQNFVWGKELLEAIEET